MVNKKALRLLFKKSDTVEFKGQKLKVWNKSYWLIQPFLVGLGYKMYFSRTAFKGWENVPADKPVIFAISHRNAFMDSLAFSVRKSMQVWQLARGDAWKGKLLPRLFNTFHMLPIWREQDGENIDTKKINEPTFQACYDLLAKNAMIGIYPEGNCVDEEHIRPLKKGICRIAFGAMDKYNFEIDVQVIPVGISYTDSVNFKGWQFMNIGKPIFVKKYEDLYRQNPAQAILQLKEEIEAGMRETVVHIKKSEFQKDIQHIATMAARSNLLSNNQTYNPETKVYAEKEVVSRLEKLKHDEPAAMRKLADDHLQYTDELKKHHFRENTFDKQKHSYLSIIFMLFYFIVFFPVAVYGVVTNYLPSVWLKRYVERRIKQTIFWSSAKYVIGLIVFPLWYLLLSVIVYLTLGSLLSALIFLLSFPIAGHIAFYYRIDFIKWWSVIRFKRMDPSARASLENLREKILQTVNSLT